MVDAFLACLVLYLFADSFAKMDTETCGDYSHMFRRLKKKQNKNNTDASGKVGVATTIIAWVNYCEINTCLTIVELL